MSERTVALLLNDILASGDKILRYTSDMAFEEFAANDLVADAVIRNFEVIGEAANRLPDDFKEKHPEIDWHRIRGFRNRIVHDYAGTDLEIVWKIKQEFLPETLLGIRKLL